MTYVALSGLFLLAALLLLVVAAVLRRPPRTWWIATGATTVALLVLTAVFDNLMIAVDLFRYEQDRISGVMVGLAPIEDFAWPLAACAGLPALALLANRRGR